MRTTALPRRALLIASLPILLAVAAGAAVRAQPGAHPAQPTRVAIVNLNKIIEGLDEAKDAKTGRDQQRADSQRQLDEINAKNKKLDQDLDLKKDQKDTPEVRAMVGQKLVLTAQGRALEQVLQQLI